MTHLKTHKSHRSGWLRAAVLGANDGIVSTASLIIGVASASASIESILLAGMAGLVAGALSMAAGEYVSVSSQKDAAEADLAIEEQSIFDDPEAETEELAAIYVERGLSEDLAQQVATSLMEHDALGAHARDDIGLTDVSKANPLKSAVFSLITFAIGAALPLISVLFADPQSLVLTVGIVSVLVLAVLGALAGLTGGASPVRGAFRVVFWGVFAMLVTALVGNLFGTLVA